MSGPQQPNAQTVARACGVSATTVREILGAHAERYRAETRDKVIAAAKRLGYRPNGAARAMARGRFRTLGLVYAGAGSFETFGSGVLEGIAEATRRLDLRLQFESAPPSGGTASAVSEGSTDGLLVMPGAGPTRGARAAHRVPRVWLNDKRAYDAVYPDEEAAGARAARMLLASGCRSLLYVGPAAGEHYSVADRPEGAARVAAEAGLELVRCDPREPGAVEALVAGLGALAAPLGLLTYGARAALAVYEQVRRRGGLRLPEDLRLATFGSDVTATLAPLPIAVLFTPQHAVGVAAVHMLEGLIAGSAARQAAQPVPYDPAWDLIAPELRALGLGDPDHERNRP